MICQSLSHGGNDRDDDLNAICPTSECDIQRPGAARGVRRRRGLSKHIRARKQCQGE